MQSANICILGGSGFVGRHLAARLAARLAAHPAAHPAAQRRRIRIPTRHADRHRDLLVLPGIELVEADIHERCVLRKLLSGMDCVINLVGILNERQHNGDGFRRAHVELPQYILDDCLALGVPRLLQMCALNADPSAPSHYLRTKAEGEHILLSAPAGAIAVTSFRPSVIFGPGDSFFNRFAGLLKSLPLAFPLACPQARFAPVYVGDVAARFVDALDDANSHGNRYELCGPRTYTLGQLVEYTAHLLGLKRRIIGLPDFAAQLQAALLEWFPGKPFSLDNYHSLQIDSVCTGVAHEPTSIESVVPLYIGKKSMQNRYDRYRSMARR